MDEQRYSLATLPQELMGLILFRLTIPTLTRLKIVCKQWNSLISYPDFTIQRPLIMNIPLTVTPTFLIELRHVSLWKRPITLFTSNLFMLEGPNCGIYKLTLDFLPSPVSVIASCKSLVLCCKHNGLHGSPTMYVCNPVIRTWRLIPSPYRLTWWDFIALTFDATLPRMILIIGRGSIRRGQKDEMEVQVYDSYAQAWNKVQVYAGTRARICPRGEGIYNKGKFYWINSIDVHSTKGDVVALDIRGGEWEIIERPQDSVPRDVSREVPFSWCLSVVYGRLMLIYKSKGFYMWELKEENGIATHWWRWKPQMKERPWELRSETWGHYAVDESGRSMVYLPKKERMMMFDESGTVVLRIDKQKLLKMKMIGDDGALPSSLRAFEANNVWWP